MSDVVIRAEGLGKSYRIGHQSKSEGYVALRDVVGDTAKGFMRSARDMLAGRQLVAGDEVEEFWALRDVNFEINRGDVVGIIGRNGAGKSTLLKILSRITEPSAGRVEIKGRVASLLEVGTGFHPELTGRENIYLNGAILGMRRAEIKRKFDEIVAFAEVEKFLDTPVKRYSSGMYVRLAFAVAAHLEPEILVVDEVLAVGDAEFQKKCLGKMGEVAGQGRTVLFVSHNVNAVKSLCRRGILLSRGVVAASGSSDFALLKYASQHINEIRPELRTKQNAQIYVKSGRASYHASPETKGSFIRLSFAISVRHPTKAALEIRIKDMLGTPVAFSTIGGFKPQDIVDFHAGEYNCELSIEDNCLANGRYLISVDITNPNIQYYDRAEDLCEIQIESVLRDGATRCLAQSYGFGSIALDASMALEPAT